MPEGRPEARPLRPHDPARLGRYDLVGRLGSGAQGTVFLGVGADGEQKAARPGAAGRSRLR
ncbi:hypothetical protein [Actinomadura sp. 7K534]|uniref:hypothetical protein n=1 Tax=Actinomadura sp. 7K534 TaxID=2530366 RepID=UPI001FB84A11|nr:hypothetical protein [Actinomadura sp. 7K534]